MLWTLYLMFHKDATRDPQDAANNEFNRYLLFKDVFIDWHGYYHPQYGKIETGGLWSSGKHPGHGYRYGQVDRAGRREIYDYCG